MARVLSLDWITPDVFEIRLEREGLFYRAGDCTLLIRSDQVDSRPYSFSSHPDEADLRFLVRKPSGVSDRGRFSPWLATRRPGDEVGVGTPFGLFAPGRSEDEVWLATGTGIAPFLSCLRGNAEVKRPVLYCGVRTPQEALFRDFLESKCHVVWAFSRTPPHRRLNVREKDFPLEPQRQYFLCGNGRMIEDCRYNLLSRGVDSAHIHEERFFS